MSFRKPLLLALILILSVFVSVALIWQGLNLDQNQEKSEVLGKKVEQSTNQDLSSTPSASQKSNTYFVSKVIDGDTFEFKSEGQIFKVRMIGIDTPETVDPRRAVGCFGKKASNETKRLIEGKEVILTKDISETDKYNRLLRYVFLPLDNGDNLFINDYLIRQGFAKTLTYPPDIKYNERFLGAEKEARDNLRGLWAECK